MSASAVLPPAESFTRTHLATLRGVLGSDRTVAELLEVSPSQISRWRQGQIPDPANADRLGGLALVVEMLGRWLEADTIEEWLRGAHLHLGGRSAVHMIRRGRVADVIGAIEAEKAGTFG